MVNEKQPEPRNYLRLKEVVGTKGGEITIWLSDKPAPKAKFRVRAENLAIQPRTQWNKKQFKKLGQDLCEIKWESDNVQYRALGFDHEGYFVMVLGCIHKGKVYDPKNALATAEKRIAEVKNGQWDTREYRHLKEEEPSK
jgi:phage-related protein